MSPRNTFKKSIDRSGHWPNWKLGAISLAAALTLTLGGCSGAGDAAGIDTGDGSTTGDTGGVSLDLYVPQNLPSTFTVEVPESITSAIESSDDYEGGGDNSGRIIAKRAEHRMKVRMAAKAGVSVSKVKFGKRGSLADDDGDGYDDDTWTSVDSDVDGYNDVTGAPVDDDYDGYNDVTGEYIDSSTSYQYSAMGFYELQNVVSQMESRKADVALNFVLADAVFDQVVAYCADQDTDAGCTIPTEAGLTVALTQEMVNFILAASETSNDDEYDNTSIESSYTSMIGVSMPVPAMTYTTLTGASGYDHQLVIADIYSEGRTASLRWDNLKSKVDLTYTFEAGDWSSSDVYTYDDSEKRVVYRNTSNFGDSKWTYSMTLQEDSSRSDTHGVFFSVRTESQDSTSSYVMDITGLADDEGGYAESTYTSTYTEITVTESDTTIDGIFGSLSPYQTYYVFEGTDCPSTMDWYSAIGSLYTWDNYSYDDYSGWWNDGDGSIDSSEVSAYLWGGAIPATYAICRYDYSYDSEWNYSESLTEVDGVTLAEGATTTSKYSYSEGWDASGMATFSAYAYCDPVTGECENYYYEYGSADTAESYEYTEYYEDATSEGGFIETPVLTLVGDTSTLSDDDGEDPYSTYILFVKAETGTPDDSWSNVVGYAYYDTWSSCTYEYDLDEDGNYVFDDYGNYSYTVTCGTPVWTLYTWGTEDELLGSDTYIATYDYNNWAWLYQATSAFSLSNGSE